MHSLMSLTATLHRWHHFSKHFTNVKDKPHQNKLHRQMLVPLHPQPCSRFSVSASDSEPFGVGGWGAEESRKMSESAKAWVGRVAERAKQAPGMSSVGVLIRGNGRGGEGEWNWNRKVVQWGWESVLSVHLLYNCRVWLWMSLPSCLQHRRRCKDRIEHPLLSPWGRLLWVQGSVPLQYKTRY